ncbi:hypothetical protein GCM10023321_39520 [Pseudonocardia eucalypti]|uniref:HTH merR-type domain-containing protein n=1 Tax=Pseudonocardia eucalypti TaxID=648755 RepID=A0ABP9QAI7_9PSEU|nr:DNA-binding transcriptional MerR regulator [Pseudonocardia eucalypti]
MDLGRLDDRDYPAVTMGQAAELLDVQPAFLRSLDAAHLLRPARSAGGHRRYSRRQLEQAARIRGLLDEGLNLDAARRIAELEDQVAELTTQLDTARRHLHSSRGAHPAVEDPDE